MKGNNRGEVAAFPLQQETRGGSGTDISDLLVDAFHRNLDISLHPNAANIDVQFSGDRLRPGGSGPRCRLKHREYVLTQRIADALVGMVHIVIAANSTP